MISAVDLVPAVPVVGLCLSSMLQASADPTFSSVLSPWPSCHRGRPTFGECVVSLGPAVPVVGSKYSNGLFVGLERCVPDLLQLHEDMV